MNTDIFLGYDVMKGTSYVSDTTEKADPETTINRQVIQIKVNACPRIYPLEVSRDEYMIWRFITNSQEEVKKLFGDLKKTTCGEDGIFQIEDDTIKGCVDTGMEEYLRNHILPYIFRKSQDIQFFFVPCNGADVNMEKLKQSLNEYNCYFELDKDGTKLHVAVEGEHMTECSEHITSFVKSHKLNATVSIERPLCVSRMLKEEHTVEKFKTEFADTSLTLHNYSNFTKFIITAANKDTLDKASKWLEHECSFGKTLLLVKGHDLERFKNIVNLFLEREVRVQEKQGTRVFWNFGVVTAEEKLEVFFCNTSGVSFNDTRDQTLKRFQSQEIDNKSIYKHLKPEKIQSILTEEGKKRNVFLEIAVDHDRTFVFYNKGQKGEVDNILSKVKGQSHSSSGTSVNSDVTDPLGAVGKVEAKEGQISYSAVRHTCWVSPKRHEIVVAQLKADLCERDVLVVIVESKDLSKFMVLFSNNILALFLISW